MTARLGCLGAAGLGAAAGSCPFPWRGWGLLLGPAPFSGSVGGLLLGPAPFSSGVGGLLLGPAPFSGCTEWGPRVGLLTFSSARVSLEQEIEG